MIAAEHGLVLRTIRLRETSKIASVLGFGHGRLRLVAHGGRTGRSGFAASLEPGNEIDLVYSLGPGRELGTLREATLRKAHLAGAGRLEVVGAGLAALELLDRLLPEGSHDPGLGEEVSEYLATLGRCPDRAAALLLFYTFELRLLGRMGLRPVLASCAACGRRAGEVPAVLLVRAGELCCQRCRAGEGEHLALAAETARLLARLASEGWEEVALLPSAAEDRKQVGTALDQLLAMHVERYRRPRGLDLLKKVDA